MRVAFLGLGIMGSRMARNMLVKGHELWVWNRTHSRTDPLVALGAHALVSPRAAAEVPALDVVCTCVADPPAMETVAFGDSGFVPALRPGVRVVDFSTLSPEMLEELERAVEARGGAFLAAPVTGSKNGAEAGTLLVMCGGRAALVDELDPLLRAVAAKVIHCGSVAQAGYVKLAGNIVVAHMMEALGEAVAFAGQGGVPLAKMLEVIQSAGFSSPYFDFKGKALAARDDAPHFSVDLLHKDLGLTLAAAFRAGLHLPGTSALRDVYAHARTQGLGARDISATVMALDSPPRERLLALDHVNIRTHRLAELVAFYRDVLGLSVGPRPPFPFPGAWLYCGDKPVVHLVAIAETGAEVPLPAAPADEPTLSHFAFGASHLSGMVGRLRAAGTPYQVQPVPGRPTTQVHLRDPDGNALHLDFETASPRGKSD